MRFSQWKAYCLAITVLVVARCLMTGLDDNLKILLWYAVLLVLYDGFGLLILSGSILAAKGLAPLRHLIAVSLAGAVTLLICANVGVFEGHEAQTVAFRIVPLAAFLVTYVGFLLVDLMKVQTRPKLNARTD